jgi:hypothetical protein
MAIGLSHTKLKTNIMRNSIKTVATLITITFISCGGDLQGNSENAYTQSEDSKEAPYEETAEMATGSSAESVSDYKKEEYVEEDQQQAITSLAASSVNDGNLRFIRKANLTYKTTSVRNTTYFLENAIVGLGGIVTYTSLYSDIQSEKKIAISKDSSLKITSFQMNNYMTIRIPNDNLDSLLKVIATSVVFLDNRNITADEISLVELKNQLEQKRLAQYQRQLKDAIKGQSDKMNKVVDAYENMLYKQKLEDEAMIRNMELDYEVEYSTVEINMYQDLSTVKELVENELNIDEFQPSFFSKLKESLWNGWNAILFFLVELANLWFVFILVIVGIVIYKRRKSKRVDV